MLTELEIHKELFLKRKKKSWKYFIQISTSIHVSIKLLLQKLFIRVTYALTFFLFIRNYLPIGPIGRLI